MDKKRDDVRRKEKKGCTKEEEMRKKGTQHVRSGQLTSLS
jgi:hypothetical protein